MKIKGQKQNQWLKSAITLFWIPKIYVSILTLCLYQLGMAGNNKFETRKKKKKKQKAHTAYVTFSLAGCCKIFRDTITRIEFQEAVTYH